MRKARLKPGGDGVRYHVMARTIHQMFLFQHKLGDRTTKLVESWLHDQVGPAFDALMEDPSRAITADQVRTRLSAEHAKMR